MIVDQLADLGIIDLSGLKALIDIDQSLPRAVPSGALIAKAAGWDAKQVESFIRLRAALGHEEQGDTRPELAFVSDEVCALAARMVQASVGTSLANLTP